MYDSTWPVTLSAMMTSKSLEEPCPVETAYAEAA